MTVIIVISVISVLEVLYFLWVVCVVIVVSGDTDYTTQHFIYFSGGKT